jgi:hypothetical protein
MIRLIKQVVGIYKDYKKRMQLIKKFSITDEELKNTKLRCKNLITAVKKLNSNE